MLVPLTLIPLFALPTLGDVITGIPDAAPPGFEQWVSPVVVPAPPVRGSGNWKSAVDRARTFVSKLTLEEKVNVTTGQGLFGRCVGNTGTVPRLGWKGLCLQDGPQGVRFQTKASAFASAINVGSTFDADLMQRHGFAMGQEFRGKGAQVALAPMMNLVRVPAAGRNWEGAGADPFHAGVAAAAAVRGIQASNVIACAKHFIGNEQEHFRGGSLAQTISSSNIDDKTMHELYLWPFAESVRAGVGSVMCSYQKVNQTQACQNSKIQNGLLKQELDFQGFIVSDWAAMINGVQPALAGLDLNMPGFRAYGQGNQNENVPVNATNSFWGSFLLEAVKNGSVPLSRLDDMVTRTFAAQYVVGQDRGFPDVNFDVNNRPGLDLDVDVQGNHAQVIREVGAASTILLKNEAKTLPVSLKAGVRRIAVIGSDAGPPRGGPNACNDRGCDNGGTVAMGWGSGTADFPYLVDPLAAINAYVKSKNASVVVDSVLNDYDYARVTQVASAADVCLVFVNANSGEGYITVDGNAGDRNNLTLWHNGETLIKTAADACNNTVVVKHIPSAVLVEDWINHPNVKSVLNAGLPGQESGNAIVDVLFGAVNPSGRLTYTVPKARGDFYDDVRYTSGGQSTPQITYEEGVNIDHRYFDATGKEPRWEFGFGLSYTTFEYSGLNVRRTGASKDLWANDYEVSFKIRNTGGVDGHEVSQLYLGFPPGAGQPPLVLRGFDRSRIRAGQSKTVTIKLRRKDVSVWDTASQKWVIPQGAFKVAVGASSRNIKLSGGF